MKFGWTSVTKDLGDSNLVSDEDTDITIIPVYSKNSEGDPSALDSTLAWKDMRIAPESIV